MGGTYGWVEMGAADVEHDPDIHQERKAVGQRYKKDSLATLRAVGETRRSLGGSYDIACIREQ